MTPIVRLLGDIHADVRQILRVREEDDGEEEEDLLRGFGLRAGVRLAGVQRFLEPSPHDLSVQ